MAGGAKRVNPVVYDAVVKLIQTKRWSFFGYPSTFYQLAVLLLLWYADVHGYMPNQRLKSASKGPAAATRAQVHIDANLRAGIGQALHGRLIVPLTERQFIDLAAHDLLRRCNNSGPADAIAGISFREQMMLLLGMRDGGQWYLRIADEVVHKRSKLSPGEKRELDRKERAGPAESVIDAEATDLLIDALVQRLSTGPKLW
ncbi:MAG: hypothetical protein AABY18_01255 [Candidatus Thermoplasmatota archaeon]